MFLELKRGENAITVARHWCGLLKRVLNEAKLSEQADKRIMEQLQLQIKYLKIISTILQRISTQNDKHLNLEI